MLSATARVRIIVGAADEAGVSENPSQPASPMAVANDIPMTSTADRVAENDRSKITIMTMMPTYIIGTSVPMSRIADSWKALLNMAIPVIATAVPG